MSQITTHILDTTLGKPAQGVAISLHALQGNYWEAIAFGNTNADGRITDLLGNHVILPLGVYKLRFEVQWYFESLGLTSFYPFVEIPFNLTTTDHYHVPLLLNPYGYSTYRGS